MGGQALPHPRAHPGVQVVSAGRKVPELHMAERVSQPGSLGRCRGGGRRQGAALGGQEPRATDRPQGKGPEERNIGCGHPAGPDQGGPMGPVHNVTMQGESSAEGAAKEEHPPPLVNPTTPFYPSMFDVGGQRDERRKWIQCFNGEFSAVSRK